MRALSDGDGVAMVHHARVFDIAIAFEDERIEPAAPVQVRIEYVDPVPAAAEAQPVMVHFAEAGVEVLDVTAESDGETIAAVDFETASFSAFAFVQANYIGSLDGQPFAIIRDNGSNLAAMMVLMMSAICGCAFVVKKKKEEAWEE